MIKLTLATPDATLIELDFDPNTLDALRQTILLGLDTAEDAGLEIGTTRLLAYALACHV